MKYVNCLTMGILVSLVAAGSGWAQPDSPPDAPRGPGRGGFGGPGGFMGQERAVLKQFDKDSNGCLDQEERKAARAFLKTQPTRGPGGPGGPGGRGFDPVGGMAQALLAALDTDKNQKLSSEETAAGVKQLATQAGANERKPVEQSKLAELIGQILPPPPMFGGGGPGGGPGGGRGNRPPNGEPRGDRPAGGRAGGFGPGGFNPGNMLAGAIIQRADQDKDGKASTDELLAASQSLFQEADKDSDRLLTEAELGGGMRSLMPGGPGGFGPGGRSREKGTPGPKVSAADVKTYGDEPLYEAQVLRTLFFQFESDDWEAELAEFHNTDVEVPATLTVDGKQYPNVGMSFRGMSSYGMIPAGSKRSFNVSIDLVNSQQRLLGYKTLNLLNAHEDPSFMSTVLYSHIARKHIPAPKANFVKVVINGESWGIYANAQQFNKEFLAENYKISKGARWKVHGSPGGGGGLEYLGENLEDYKRRYQIKSNDNNDVWKAFVAFCKTLNKTPQGKLEAALEPILDIDQALWFLALDVALINNDGYWVRASDYSIFRDTGGVFHIVPHDMNEAFHGAMMMGGRGPGGGRPGGGPGGPPPSGPGGFGPPGRPGGFGPGGPGGRGGPRGSGLELDPLIGLDDSGKPLRSKLLAVPKLKARYLEHVRTIATEDLNWETLGPVVAQYRELIQDEIKADTRKLTSFAEFEAAVSDTVADTPKTDGRQRDSLRSFAEQRRAYLLKVTQK